MKNKEWLKKELVKQIDILHTTISSGNYVSTVKRYEINSLIDQLEEPELTQDQVDKYLYERNFVAVDATMVVQTGMQNKVIIEKPVIPQYVADWIESYRKKTLVELINDAVYSSDEYSKCFRRWFHEEMGFESNYSEFLARAWLDGYEVEEEKLYKVELPTETLHHILTMHGDGKGHFFGKEHTNNFWYRTYLTETEIKAIDKRYWSFAEEVRE